MIFVDTSVWVVFFRDRNSPVAQRLMNLLDEDQVALPFPVWIELLSGSSKKNIGQLRRVLSALPRFPTTDAVWETVEAWTFRAIENGQRFGAMDLLVGAIASTENGQVWSLDRDFSRMAGLGFVKLAS